MVLQALNGETEMAGFTGILVHASFRSAALLASRRWGDHRASVRYDRFEVDDEDATPDDPNDETGHAWTVAWIRESEGTERSGGRPILAAEVLTVDSVGPARAFFGESPGRGEVALQLSTGWRL